MAINRVMVSGNVTRDPELRQTANGTAVLNFGLAVNDRRKNPQTDEWEDYANFFECSMFGNRANTMSQYVAKGMKVVIEGKLRYSQWEKDGQKRSSVKVVVEEVVLMNRRGQQDAGQQGQSKYGEWQDSQYAASASVYDEDIPF